MSHEPTASFRVPAGHYAVAEQLAEAMHDGNLSRAWRGIVAAGVAALEREEEEGEEREIAVRVNGQPSQPVRMH